MIRKLSFAVLGIGIFFSVYAQNPDCVSDFNYLVNKIKTDYPGYHDKVMKKTEKDLEDLELKLRYKLSKYPDSCGSCLDEYVCWFRDSHLKVRYNWTKKHADPGKKPKIVPQVLKLNSELPIRKFCVIGRLYFGDLIILKNILFPPELFWVYKKT